METAIVSIVCIALFVVGGMTMSQNFLSSVDSTTTSFNNVSQIDEKKVRTNIAVVEVSQPASDRINLTLRNNGQVKLSEFSKWDFIIQYYASANPGAPVNVKWLPYTSGTPGNDQWTVEGIYMDAATNKTEVFEPGILNPNEEVVFEAMINPGVGNNTTNMITVSTPSGVTASTFFTWR